MYGCAFRGTNGSELYFVPIRMSPFSDQQIDLAKIIQVLNRNVDSEVIALKKDLLFSSACYIKIIVLPKTFL